MKKSNAEVLVGAIQRQIPLWKPRIVTIRGWCGYAVMVTHPDYNRAIVVNNEKEWESVYEMWTEVLDKESA